MRRTGGEKKVDHSLKNFSLKNKFLMSPVKEIVECYNELNDLISTDLSISILVHVKNFICFFHNP
jgi:hypothetical protein